MSLKTAAHLMAETAGVTDFDDEELARLNTVLDESEAQYQRGEYVDVEVVLHKLRARSATSG